MLVLVLCAALLACAAASYDVVVVTRWRDKRDMPWQTQPADAGPRWGTGTKLVVPRPLVPHEKREMEFSFSRGGDVATTPFVVIYEPDSSQLVKEIEFTFESAGKRLLGVRHRAVYETLAQHPNRVFFTVTYLWQEHRELDATTGLNVLFVWLLVLAVAVGVIVLADEFLRGRAYLGEAQMSKHSSNSPLIRRRPRGVSSPGGSGDASPIIFNSPELKKRE
jgi:hypothetical protein